MEKRTCSECGDVLMGRADKKFCSDNCRNAYNNRVSGDSNNAMRRTILVLKKNRRILDELYKSDKKKINKKTLLEKGYDYNKLTHFYVNKKNQTYRFCFDYGFVEYEDGWLFLVTDKVNGEAENISS
jgi:predicted nucleic acid-binding Zn ribbon protein